ncbi:MAG: hypothetical protein KAX44_04010 [Candidatus Brocadiae bacterium]|nr:hypothetical protein [Candidatus Brocadiia bacterium]
MAAKGDQMSMELCRRCGVLRNVCVTTSRRTVVQPDGTTIEVETRAYHCETCNTFIRSEDVKEADDTVGDQSAQT